MRDAIAFVSLVIKKITKGQDIEKVDLSKAFTFILNHQLGEANEASFGALFAALQTKGPTVEEITALTDVVLNYDRISIPYSGTDDLCGIVGTGKDDLKTFNVSTAAAIVAAACGAKVVKNGSRSESSIAGTTDVLEELGVNVQADPEVIIKTLRATNVTFCDAEPFFPRMGREYVGKFIFPHPLSYTLSIASGLSFKKMVFGSAFGETEFIAHILQKLGMTRFLVVAGNDLNGLSLDEISTIGPTRVTEYLGSGFNTYQVFPEDVGLPMAKYADIQQSSSVRGNAEIIRNIILHKEAGPRQDIVVLNAGALLYVDGKAQSIKDGVEQAKQAIKSGSAAETLRQLIEKSNEN